MKLASLAVQGLSALLAKRARRCRDLGQTDDENARHERQAREERNDERKIEGSPWLNPVRAVGSHRRERAGRESGSSRWKAKACRDVAFPGESDLGET